MPPPTPSALDTAAIGGMPPRGGQVISGVTHGKLAIARTGARRIESLKVAT